MFCYRAPLPAPLGQPADWQRQTLGPGPVPLPRLQPGHGPGAPGPRLRASPRAL